MSLRKSKKTACQNPRYDPNLLLDWLHVHLGVKSDAELARALRLSPSILSKLRHERTDVGPAVLLRMHDVAKVSASSLRAVMEVSEPMHLSSSTAIS